MNQRRNFIRIKIAHLYPDASDPYDDARNVLALRERCEWRGISTEVLEVRAGDYVSLSQVDLLFMGANQDMAQHAIAQDLLRHRGMIHDLVDEGVPALAICGAFQLFGRGCTTASGDEIKGLGVFDAWTILSSERTFAGGIAIEARLSLLGEPESADPIEIVGFEAHTGVTRLGEGSTPFGKVLRGAGSLGDGSAEGAVYKNAIGTYLYGPVLQRNPILADHLIRGALRHRYGVAEELPEGAGEGEPSASVRATAG